MALKYASPELKNNLSIVLTAVSDNGMALQFASPELKNNLSIVLEAIKQNHGAFEFASQELKYNNVVRAAAGVRSISNW